MNNQSQVITAIDIGSSKVCCVIAKFARNGWQVKGYGVSYYQGAVVDGVVNDSEITTLALKEAYENASRIYGQSPTSVVLSIGGTHIYSKDQEGVITLDSKSLTAQDIERVISNAVKLISVGASEQVLHKCARYYKIDNAKRVQNPVGIVANSRLDSSVHAVMGDKNASDNLSHILEQNCGLKISTLVANPWASASAVCSKTELKTGRIVIDIGADITDVLVYQSGNGPLATYCLKGGGRDITTDIAQRFGLGVKTAEELKKLHGKACSSQLTEEDDMEIEIDDFIIVPKLELAALIEQHYSRIFENILHKCEECGEANLNAIHGIILTGGASQAVGLPALANQIFQRAAKVSTPKNALSPTAAFRDEIFDDPQFSTLIGLLKFVEPEMNSSEKLTQTQLSMAITTDNERKEKSRLGKVWDWVVEHF